MKREMLHRILSESEGMNRKEMINYLSKNFTMEQLKEIKQITHNLYMLCSFAKEGV